MDCGHIADSAAMVGNRSCGGSKPDEFHGDALPADRCVAAIPSRVGAGVYSRDRFSDRGITRSSRVERRHVGGVRDRLECSLLEKLISAETVAGRFRF